MWWLSRNPPHAFKIRGGCEGGGKGYLGMDEQVFTITTGHDQQVAVPIAIATKQMGQNVELDIANTLAANDYKEPQVVAVPIAWDEELNPSENIAGTLLRGGQGGRHDGVAVPVADVVAFHHNAQACQLPSTGKDTSISDSLTCSQQAAVATRYAVRRLTPTECERLQGFPDGYTDIQPKGKPTPDGPRYKALGNSWAVPVVRWIGRRIAAALQPPVESSTP